MANVAIRTEKVLKRARLNIDFISFIVQNMLPIRAVWMSAFLRLERELARRKFDFGKERFPEQLTMAALMACHFYRRYKGNRGGAAEGLEMQTAKYSDNTRNRDLPQRRVEEGREAQRRSFYPRIVRLITA